MPADTTSVIQSLLFDSLVIAFLVFGVAAAAAGIGIIACRERMFRLFALMNRHISTRQAFRTASVPHDIGPLVRRYRWWFTAAIIAGSVYSLYILLARFETSVITAAVTGGAAGPLGEVVVDSLRWFMVVCSAVACVVGILLGFSPRTLQTLEAYSNRWYSMRKATAPLETPNHALDRWVEAHPLLAGWSITLGALIVVVSSGIILFGP